jgi:predicted nucleic acid-binding Zn ribbon protein
VSRRAPRPLASALAPLQAALAPATLLAEAQRVWPDAAGPAVAREAAPTAERDGVLTVVCASSVWAQELDLMAPLVLERLNALLTGGEVRRLRCVAAAGRGAPRS